MIVKVFYSPSFTGECYRDLPVNEPRFEKVVGDAGLLKAYKETLESGSLKEDHLIYALTYSGESLTVWITEQNVIK